MDICCFNTIITVNQSSVLLQAEEGKVGTVGLRHGACDWRRPQVHLHQSCMRTESLHVPTNANGLSDSITIGN